MKTYYKKLLNGQWKVYLFVFFKKGTKQRLYLKPGITEFQDANARMFFNNLNEDVSFLQHLDSEVLWSKTFPNKVEAEKFETYLLEYFGEQADMGFKTGGYTEVRDYNHEKWMGIVDQLYKK